MIHVEGLRKIYNRHLAVDDISFDLEPGQICGLVGPNGAGKTTVMRCLAGLIPASDGSMSVGGFDSRTNLIELKRQLAYVPDDPPLFDDLSVAQHLELMGRLYKVSQFNRKANRLLETFDLVDKLDAGATTLSRGMRQKLAVCCAYLFDPKVLLLDEPMTGLDPPGIRELLQSVRDRAEAGATVMISSHLLPMIEGVCTHYLVMKRGQLRFFGSVNQLRSHYASTCTLEDAYFAAIDENLSSNASPSPTDQVLEMEVVA
ncbi:ABC transporter ATP-binding protein [Novipirellula artificiosorum]|uniref:ABC-type transporter ATP-binding protein EcsA n=1 Tax=Novipirellula artificiosorum TaxID=2528016 RepID=A0A5C6DJH1_9BACT|nr:ABC transporter ATP-binding protein [Novipirellula artificiosorum]TWU35056.1 ABC-type transporter ATP-binding protein EcsA [Novipirellula artificiosorum]